MNYTNLNIVSQEKSFKYIIEYYDDFTIQSEPLQYYKTEQGFFFVSNEQTNVVHKKNYWTDIEQPVVSTDTPAAYNKSSFNLYFPRFSVETYERNVKYVLTINTWVNGKYVFLGSYLIDRSNAKACESGVRKFMNTEYYEYVHLETIDPVYLIYGDEWKDFRVNQCGEKVIDNVQANNTASNLNFTLTPVRMYQDTWLKLDGYDSSQSALLLNNSINNYMKANLVFSFDDGAPKYSLGVSYNTVYSSLKEYLLETYQLDADEFDSKFILIFKDKENAYKYIEHTCAGACESSDFLYDEIKYNKWSEFIPGVCASALYILSKDDTDILAVASNNLMIDQEVFKYLVCETPINKVNFDELDMNTQQFDVVNVIEHNVITVERPEDYKANIIKPIFVKVQQANSIRLHPSVTENIVLNLDAYKNKVDTFVLKINNTNFYEIGRINTGIVFKIVGSNLNSDEQTGTYYILNEDGELVTTGNYTIQQ